jgi:hypothetical protein
MRARFEQVKQGMSREEVIRTVGGPPGDYSQGRCGIRGHLLRQHEAETAVDVHLVTNQSPFDRIRRWLGW